MTARTDDATWKRLLLPFVLLLVVLVGLYLSPFHEWLTVAVEWSRGNLPAAGIAYIVLFVAGAVFMLPGSIMLMIGGYLFGLVYAIPVALLATTLGAHGAFITGHSVARPLVLRRIERYPRLLALDAGLREHALLIVALLRLSLLVPFAVMNYALSLTAVRPSHYFFGTAVGMIPAVCVYTYLGSLARNLGQILQGDVEPGGWGQALFVLGLLAVIALAVIIHRVASRILRQYMETGEGGA
jgi:uncharacterized membrane protein YdjX (TVP38/TMEM64 family)